MRRMLVLMPGLGLLFAAMYVSAQTAPPTGPYSGSCQNAHMRGTTLYASCPTVGGQMVAARLDHAERCSDGIINLNGVLSCQQGTIPPGSYLSTCADPRVLGTTLSAKCQNDKGKEVAAELRNANQCPGDIANKDGALRCVTSAQAGAPPQEQKKEEKKRRGLWSFKRSN